MLYTIDIKSENKPGVLYRLSGLLTKRKINIKRINAYEIKESNLSLIFLTADIDEAVIETLVKQINRIIEVKEVSYHKASH